MSTSNVKTILAIQNDETDPPHLVGRWLMELGFEIKILRAYAGASVPTTVFPTLTVYTVFATYFEDFESFAADFAE